MQDEGKAGIGTVVMRKKQYLAAIRPLDGALAMSTMRFADEVVPQKDIDALPGKGAKPEPKELKLASQIIGSLATEWDPTRYHDTYTEELKRLIEAKAKGKEIVVEEEAPATDNVLDLMQALEASLEAAKKGGGRKMASEVAKVAEQLAEEADDADDDEKPAASVEAHPEGAGQEAGVSEEVAGEEERLTSCGAGRARVAPWPTSSSAEAASSACRPPCCWPVTAIGSPSSSAMPLPRRRLPMRGASGRGPASASSISPTSCIPVSA